MNKILLSYAVHINNYNEIKVIEYCLSFLSKYCKQIGISYSISNDIDDNKIKNLLKTLNKFKNIKIYPKIKNVGYDFKKHVNTITQFKIDNLIEKDYYILLMNDSVIPINSKYLDLTFSRITELIELGYEYIGFLESNQIKTHYQSWFWLFNEKLKDLILSKINYILNNKNIKLSKPIIIHKLEIEISNSLINNKKSTYIYKFDLPKNIFYFHLDDLLKAIDNDFPFLKKNYFSIKFRKKNKIDFCPELINYLPRNIFKIICNL